MPLKTILRTMLPGLFPIILYVAVDSVYGAIPGVVAAVFLGIVEYFYTYFKWHYCDKFIFTDTIVLVSLGLLSLLSGDDIFFKLKPAFLNLFFIAIFGISSFSSKNIMLKMSERFVKSISFNEKALQKMKKISLIMFVFFVIHTFMIVISAFYMKKETWAFISVTLPYIFIGSVFICIIILKLIKK